MDVTQQLFYRFRRNWKQVFGFPDTDRLLVACSGGSDSVALVHLLRRMGQSFVIAHVNHGLRGPESDAEEAFVENLARQVEQPFTVAHLKPEYPYRRGLQADARHLRWKWLEAEAHRLNCQWIATGHHLDDQAETLLYRLLRSKGNQVFQGLQPIRGTRVKPLLFAHKSELQEWLTQEGLAWREDSSNAKDTYARNLIRNQLNPLLARLHSDYAAALQERAERYTLQWETLRRYLNRNLRPCIHMEAEGEWLNLSTARRRLKGDPKVLVAYWVEFRLRGAHPLQQKAMELVELPEGTTRTAEGWELSRLRDGIRASRLHLPPEPRSKPLLLNESLRFGGWELRIEQAEPGTPDWKNLPPYQWYFSPPQPYAEMEFTVEYPAADQRIQLLGSMERSMSRYLAETRKLLPPGTSLIQLAQGSNPLLLLPLRPAETARVQPGSRARETYKLSAKPIASGWLPLANDL